MTEQKKDIFDAPITKLVDYVGNIKANSKSIEFKQLKNYLKTYFNNYIITIESKDTAKEHCHFWASGCKLKPTINTETTLKNYLRRDIPTLKRNGKGGENKKVIKIMNEEYQFYYIFKEQTEKTLKDITTIGYAINKTNLNKYLKNYSRITKAKKGGKAGQYYLYCTDKLGYNSRLLQNRGCLIELYMDWCDAYYTCPTINLCDRYVNGVL